MTHAVNIPSSAFNVERVRAQMLERVQMPADLLQLAIDKLHSKLNAKTTKFFPFQGNVVETAEVEDHAIQLEAADRVLKIAGVYARERDAVPQAPQVALEMDPRTGVVRLVVGTANTFPDLVGLPVDDALKLPLVADTSSNLSESSELGKEVVGTTPEEEPPKVVKVRRGNLPIGVFNALFGESDGPA